MSELVNNLQSIYNIKLQIKDVLGTDSDLFEDYPDLIEEAIGEGGGSGSSVDPFYNYYDTVAMIANEMSSADYAGSVISDNFNVTLDANDAVEAVEWDENIVIDVEGTDVDKVVHVIVNGDPHEIFTLANDIAQSLDDYPDLYDNVFPVLENATLTASEDPSNDGYDYLLEGDIYAWNLSDNCGEVPISNYVGFHPTNSLLGIDIQFNNQGTYYMILDDNSSGEIDSIVWGQGDGEISEIWECVKAYACTSAEDGEYDCLYRVQRLDDPTAHLDMSPFIMNNGYIFYADLGGAVWHDTQFKFQKAEVTWEPDMSDPNIINRTVGTYEDCSAAFQVDPNSTGVKLYVIDDGVDIIGVENGKWKCEIVEGE